MKRKTKNIIVIGIMIIMIGLTVFTVVKAKNSMGSFGNMMEMGGNPPSMSSTDVSQTPPEKADGDNSQTPPEKPEGSDSQTPPEKPEGDNNQQDNMQSGQNDNEMSKPEMPSENNMSSKLETKYYVFFGIESLIISILLVYLIMSNFNSKNIKETFANKDKIIIGILSIVVVTALLTTLCVFIVTYVNNNNSNNGFEGGNSTNITYSSKNEITENTTIDSESYSSTTKDENVILVSGEIDVNLSNINVSKNGDSDGGDNTSFYGTNSAIIAKDGVTLTISNATIETNATGANGVFSYGGSATTSNSSSDGTTVIISDSKITTTKDNSGGIMTTGGGIMNASNLTINTSGTSSAAIRSDRGGGTVSVDGGTYTTTGKGSPSIYSTANITVKNATLNSETSEGIVIEGKNSVTIDNVNLTDNNDELNGQSTTYKNIFIYQSMSGDADTGTATFNSKNSSITTNEGDTIYVTNTKCNITLENNTIVNNDSTGNFLRAKSDSWGNSGSNGGEVVLTMTNQKVSGNIIIDSISTLEMTLKENSYLESTINSDNSAKNISLTLDSTSKIKLTGDSYVTSFNNEDESNSNIDFNGYKLYVNGKSIN